MEKHNLDSASGNDCRILEDEEEVEEPDLYAILGLTKYSNPTANQLRSAYRKLAIRHHPDKNLHCREEAERKFKEIANAFTILSNEELRHKYDLYGMDGLDDNNNCRKSSGKGEGGDEGRDDDDGSGDEVPESQYDSKEVFDNFFDGDNPFVNLGFDDITDFRSRKKVRSEAKGASKDEKDECLHLESSSIRNECHDLPCTLEELYLGIEKIIKITRTIYSAQKGSSDNDGSDEDMFVEESKILRIQLQPGIEEGTIFNFPGDGDEYKVKKSTPANINTNTTMVLAGDLSFKVVQSPHDRFARRKGDAADLIYIARITLLQALTDFTLKIYTLSGKTVYMSCPEVIPPSSPSLCRYERIIYGEGIILGAAATAVKAARDYQTRKRGNLIIRFEIDFPKVLTRGTKAQLSQDLH